MTGARANRRGELQPQRSRGTSSQHAGTKALADRSTNAQVVHHRQRLSFWKCSTKFQLCLKQSCASSSTCLLSTRSRVRAQAFFSLNFFAPTTIPALPPRVLRCTTTSRHHARAPGSRLAAGVQLLRRAMHTHAAALMLRPRRRSRGATHDPHGNTQSAYPRGTAGSTGPNARGEARRATKRAAPRQWGRTRAALRTK